MNKSIFIILIAIIATLGSILLQNYTRDREISPKLKIFFRVMLVVGIVVFVVVLGSAIFR